MFSALSHSVVWQQHGPGRERLAMSRRPEEARHENEEHNDQGTEFHNILLLTFNMLAKSNVQIPNNIKPL